jgi:hypothetical protein
MEEVGGIKVKIGADDSELQAKLSGAVLSVAKWSAAVGAAAAAATAAMVKSGLATGDALAKQAQQLNTTVDDLTKLKRAADLAGVSQSTLEGASRALTTRLSMAAAGSGDAAKALETLGLSASELQKLPLTERIKTINEALANNVDASQRAGLASKIFGEEAGLAVSQIDVATLERAAKEVDRFGAGLSEVDAAKIEAANDSMSQIGLAFEGASLQLAAEFAPMLKLIGDSFGDAAEESGLFQDAIGRGVDTAVVVVAKLADALVVVGNVIQSVPEVGKLAFNALALAAGEVAQSILEAYDAMNRGVVETFNAVIRAANNIPGVDISEIIVGDNEALENIKAFNAGLVDNMTNAKNELAYIWSAPLPSDGLIASYEESKRITEEQAQLVADARAAMRKESTRITEEQAQIAAASIAAMREGAGGEGSTEESPELIKMREDAQAKYDFMMEQFASEQELLAEQRAVEMETLQAAYDAKLIAEEEYLLNKAMLDEEYLDEDYNRKAEYEKAKEQLEKTKRDAQLGAAKSMFGNLSSLMSTENKKLFEIGKAAALAEATIKGYEAIQSSYAQGSKIGGPAVGAAFAATAAVATAVQIANIASTQFGGGSKAMTAGVGGGTVPVGTSQGAQPVAQTPVGGTLTVSGLDSGALFTGDVVSKLASELLDYQKSGGNIVFQG